MSVPPPPVYAPAVLFFDETEDFDKYDLGYFLEIAHNHQGGVTGILVQRSNGEAQLPGRGHSVD